LLGLVVGYMGMGWMNTGQIDTRWNTLGQVGLGNRLVTAIEVRLSTYLLVSDSIVSYWY
jgi:hypothetical protein